jgi:hypothetical protein
MKFVLLWGDINKQAVTHFWECRGDSSQYTPIGDKPDNTTYARSLGTLCLATVHMTMKELVWVQPFPSARLPRNTSPDYPWVARTLSRYTSLHEWWGTQLSLGMIFKNINLDGITCIQKFEDPLQMANGLKWKIHKIWIATRVCTVDAL